MNHKKRKFERCRLPNPMDYYRQLFSYLPVRTDMKWVNVCCCFHEDNKPSLSLNLLSGGFHCFGCGAKGGDVLAFHMLRFGIPFTKAVTFFGAWIYE
jgi:DNA primase